MKKNAIILANSNLFQVYCHSVLRKYFDCDVLHLRYRNENMSRMDHLIQQIKEVFDDDFYNRGLIFSKYDFSFNNLLTQRIDTMFRNVRPDILFIEMKTCKTPEWVLLDYIHKIYNIPVVVLIPNEEDSEETLIRLCKLGVQEVMTTLDVSSLQQIAKRHSKTHF